MTGIIFYNQSKGNKIVLEYVEKMKEKFSYKYLIKEILKNLNYNLVKDTHSLTLLVISINLSLLVLNDNLKVIDLEKNVLGVLIGLFIISNVILKLLKKVIIFLREFISNLNNELLKIIKARKDKKMLEVYKKILKNMNFKVLMFIFYLCFLVISNIVIIIKQKNILFKNSSMALFLILIMWTGYIFLFNINISYDKEKNILMKVLKSNNIKEFSSEIKEILKQNIKVEIKKIKITKIPYILISIIISIGVIILDKLKELFSLNFKVNYENLRINGQVVKKMLVIFLKNFPPLICLIFLISSISFIILVRYFFMKELIILYRMNVVVEEYNI